MTDARATSPMDLVLGRKLRSARTEAGLSQQALADRLGITFQQIQKYEKGANRIAASRLVSIAAAVDRPIGYFLDEAKEAAANGRAAQRPSSEVWFSPENVTLAAAFTSIESAKVRRRVVDLLRAIVEASRMTVLEDVARPRKRSIRASRRARGMRRT